MLLFVLCVVLAFIKARASVIFEDCGSAYDLQAVNIEGCGWSLPCYVTAGEETPVDVHFFADFSSNLLDQDVVININLVNLNADVTPDPCESVHCPVRTDFVNSLTSVMSVPNMMALNQRGYLRWRVYNERRRLVLCYSVLVQTQSPVQKKLRQILTMITPEHANEIVDTLDPETKDTDITKNYLQELVDNYHENIKLRRQLANTNR
ncbi:uncharacterized protein LOC126374952 [Pectinophora gossypiella]|uniref:MD-2-related lipid-recognition domain-containing protein n=1 Tax=Pectinophora gossypiella TaxID=13191 RepID=A0A1E1W9T0_PECGO|nr:uncharacterized protein LOC126374952 [Pectinophora gossypiella]